jgi:chlorobactene glucosyltransferase
MTNTALLLIPNIPVILFLLMLLTIAVINMKATKNMRDYTRLSRYPRITVMIPARNEEEKIGGCVSSLLNQNYPDFQVIVLNDHSTDRTGEILSSLALGDNRLKVINGTPLPPNWLGKHWACHQLSQEADGELLMFTDADTVHTPDTLRCAAASMEGEQADMISIMPHHILVTWSEQLIMPIFALGAFAQVPLLKQLRPAKRATLSSSGKLMMFRRQAYDNIGGFQAIKQIVLDDLEFPQRIYDRGLRYRLLDGTNNVSCRMYHNFKELHTGLTKNSFASYDYHIWLYILLWTWLLFVFWEPLIAILVFKDFSFPPVLAIGLSLIAIIGSLLLWTLYYHRFKFPLHMVFLYPLSITAMGAISISSLILTLTGRATWKDRRLPNRKIN